MLTRPSASESPRRGRPFPVPEDGHPGLVPRWLPFVVLVVAWAAVYPGMRHAGGPDGTAYITIGELWFTGQWSDAVNAYWGPLLSWLAGPLLVLGVPGFVALRLVILGAALVSLVPLRSLARAAGASAAATDAVVLGVVPFLVYAAHVAAAPDLLLAASLLGAAAVLARHDVTTSGRVAALAGLLTGVAFLAKAWALPVVVVFVPLAAVWHVLPPIGAPWRRVVGRAAVVLGVFGVVLGGWAAVLSVGYGSPTLSTSAAYNARIADPGSAGNPLWWPGLHPPPHADSLSAWEEPSRLPAVRLDEVADPSAPAPVTAPPSEVRQRLQTVGANARAVLAVAGWRAAPLAVLALVAVAWHVGRRRWPAPGLSVSMTLLAVNAAGLVAFIAEERYAWVSVLAAVPAAAVGLDLVAGRDRRRVLVAAAVLVLVGTASAAYALSPRWDDHREVAQAAEALDADLLNGAEVAGLGSWHETLLLCDRVGCRYHGRPAATDTDAAAAELRRGGVTHLVVWRVDAGALAGLPAADPSSDLAVYRVGSGALELEASVRLDG
jgi:hypothetical protein